MQLDFRRHGSDGDVEHDGRVQRVAGVDLFVADALVEVGSRKAVDGVLLAIGVEQLLRGRVQALRPVADVADGHRHLDVLALRGLRQVFRADGRDGWRDRGDDKLELAVAHWDADSRLSRLGRVRRSRFF